MKLSELNPRFADSMSVPGGGWNLSARRNIGLSFECPHCRKIRMFVHFRNPIGEGSPEPNVLLWEREGDTFEEMTLRPSIDNSAQGHAHVSIIAGEVHVVA